MDNALSNPHCSRHRILDRAVLLAAVHRWHDREVDRWGRVGRPRRLGVRVSNALPPWLLTHPRRRRVTVPLTERLSTRCWIVTVERFRIGHAHLVDKRQIIGAGLALVFVALLAACSGTPADPVEAARKLDGAPSWVHVPTGKDCGQVEVHGNGELPGEALRCLDQLARHGRTATLAWIQRTTEGDPVPFFAQVNGTAVKVASTSAYDSYGQSGWTVSSCAELLALPACE